MLFALAKFMSRMRNKKPSQVDNFFYVNAVKEKWQQRSSRLKLLTADMEEEYEHVRQKLIEEKGIWLQKSRRKEEDLDPTGGFDRQKRNLRERGALQQEQRGFDSLSFVRWKVDKQLKQAMQERFCGDSPVTRQRTAGPPPHEPVWIAGDTRYNSNLEASKQRIAALRALEWDGMEGPGDLPHLFIGLSAPQRDAMAAPRAPGPGPGGPHAPRPPTEEPCRLGKADEKVPALRHVSSVATVHCDLMLLCLPTKMRTFLASVLACGFTFSGLLIWGFAELGLPQVPQKHWLTLLLRCVGWAFLYYIPLPVISSTSLWKYLLYGVHPAENLLKAFASHDRCIFLRAFGFIPLLHFLSGTAAVFLICVPIGEDRMGLVSILLVGHVVSTLVSVLTIALLGPKPLCLRYARGVLFLIAFFPMLGAAVVVSGYIPLRHLGGASVGLLMPLLLSAFEQIGTLLVTRRFVARFVTEIEIRERYSATNQGICVSMAICNLHAMAEGARLTLLYAESLQNDEWTILIPVICGVVWNVSMRIGCLDRFLHFISCGRWKPNNSTKFLRESSYCMGYARFGAFTAVMLTRLCLGQLGQLRLLRFWEVPESRPLLLAFGAEVTEDVIAYSLWRAKVDLYPESRFATDQEVEKVSQRLARRSSTVVPAVPATKSQDLKSLHSLRWKIRAAHDFKYGPSSFRQLPLWAHFMPVALAQFHTILAMTIVSNGLVYMLTLCENPSGSSHGVFWWPMPDATSGLCERQ
eukprot:s1896_g3.t1